MGEVQSLSLQTRLIRQKQEKDGQIACYAIHSAKECSIKSCDWKHDCFEEIQDTFTSSLDFRK